MLNEILILWNEILIFARNGILIFADQFSSLQRPQNTQLWSLSGLSEAEIVSMYGDFKVNPLVRSRGEDWTQYGYAW